MDEFQDVPKGYCANGGKSRYLLEADSTTGFTAWRMADGTTLVSPARQVSLRESDHVEFWACAGYQDTTPAGEIVAFDCHGNDLTELDVTRLKGLKYLDCCYNRLKRLDLTGLTELQVLEVGHNRISRLEVKYLKKLRVLNWEGERLKC